MKIRERLVIVAQRVLKNTWEMLAGLVWLLSRRKKLTTPIRTFLSSRRCFDSPRFATENAKTRHSHPGVPSSYIVKNFNSRNDKNCNRFSRNSREETRLPSGLRIPVFCGPSLQFSIPKPGNQRHTSFLFLNDFLNADTRQFKYSKLHFLCN